MSTTRTLCALVLAAALSGLGGCGGSSRYLIVTHITHFSVQGNGTTLNFPLFAQTMAVEEIERDLDVAEYYHRKLAALYDFKSFTLVQSGTSQMLLPKEGVIRLEDPIYSYEDSLAEIELWPTGFGEKEAEYELRFSGGPDGATRRHTVSVPNRQSASVGLLYDPTNNRGYLIAITLHIMEITRSTTPQELAEFLQEKNSIGTTKSYRWYNEGDQRRMDDLFGAKAISLPTAPEKPREKGEQEPLTDYDTPPSPVGGMMALQQAVVYPPEARDEGREGRVLVKVRIDTEGTVTDHKIAASAGGDLDQAALDAVRSTRFVPAMKAGKPVAVWVVIPVQFKLK